MLKFLRSTNRLKKNDLYCQLFQEQDIQQFHKNCMSIHLPLKILLIQNLPVLCIRPPLTKHFQALDLYAQPSFHEVLQKQVLIKLRKTWQCLLGIFLLEKDFHKDFRLLHNLRRSKFSLNFERQNPFLTKKDAQLKAEFLSRFGYFKFVLYQLECLYEFFSLHIIFQMILISQEKPCQMNLYQWLLKFWNLLMIWDWQLDFL